MRLVAEAIHPRRDLQSVTLTIGPLSGIAPHALRFCFAAVAEAQGLGSPELIIHEVPARVHCRDCEREDAVHDFFEPCPGCGGMNRTILSGNEFTVDSAELSGDDDDE